jgi:hypothetical protein
MPGVADLPESMSEAELMQRYGSIGGPGYNSMMATIDARVASRPLLRQRLLTAYRDRANRPPSRIGRRAKVSEFPISCRWAHRLDGTREKTRDVA